VAAAVAAAAAAAEEAAAAAAGAAEAASPEAGAAAEGEAGAADAVSEAADAAADEMEETFMTPRLTRRPFRRSLNAPGGPKGDETLSLLSVPCKKTHICHTPHAMTRRERTRRERDLRVMTRTKKLRLAVKNVRAVGRAWSFFSHSKLRVRVGRSALATSISFARATPHLTCRPTSLPFGSLVSSDTLGVTGACLHGPKP
jgi:hypothetical protein